MASFRQRNGKWQARISAKGFPAEVKSFNTKGEAQRWATQVEASMANRTYQKSTLADEQLLFDVLQRYSTEVSPKKRGVKREREGIAFMQRQKMAQYSMSNLSSTVIAEYRDERLRTVSAGTIIRELSILSSIINHARKEWGLPITNPCDLVRKPSSPQGRNRILSNDEEAELLRELLPKGRRSIWMRPLVELALETAMRRGEASTSFVQKKTESGRRIKRPLLPNRPSLFKGVGGWLDRKAHADLTRASFRAWNNLPLMLVCATANGLLSA